MNGDEIAKGLLEKAKAYKKVYLEWKKRDDYDFNEMQDTENNLLNYIVKYVEIERED